jgi:hypothetical protein
VHKLALPSLANFDWCLYPRPTAKNRLSAVDLDQTQYGPFLAEARPSMIKSDEEKKRIFPVIDGLHSKGREA